jgi:hypothetical protein
MGVSGQRHAPAYFTPGKEPGTYWIGEWVGLRTDLDTEARGQILFLCRGWNPSHTVCQLTAWPPRWKTTLCWPSAAPYPSYPQLRFITGGRLHQQHEDPPTYGYKGTWNEMCAQGDPCTTTVFWYIVRPRLLYSASSPVHLTNNSILHKGRLVPQKCLPNRGRLNSGKAFSIFFLWVSCGPYQSHKNLGIKQSPPTEPNAGGRHTYGWVLPGTSKGSFATLLSPPQCHAAFGTKPHTLALVDQSPVRRPRTLPPSLPPWQGSLGLDFGGCTGTEPGNAPNHSYKRTYALNKHSVATIKLQDCMLRPELLNLFVMHDQINLQCLFITT